MPDSGHGKEPRALGRADTGVEWGNVEAEDPPPSAFRPGCVVSLLHLFPEWVPGLVDLAGSTQLLRA